MPGTTIYATPTLDGLPSELVELAVRLDAPHVLGFPAARDIDFSPILPLFAQQAINVGSPESESVYTRNTNDLEAQVCFRLTTEVFRGDPDRWHSYITAGTTLAIQHSIITAVRKLTGGQQRWWHRRPVVYASEVAHSCVEKIAGNLRLPFMSVPSLHGQMDMDAFAALVDPRRPIVFIATIGTTMVEGIDDIAQARRVLHGLGVPSERMWVHADAALSGVPLALTDHPPDGARLDRDTVNSLSVSGHKFFGTHASAWCAIRKDAVAGKTLEYTGDFDDTQEGCRAGHVPLMWWWVLHSQGIEGLRARAEYSRRLAAETCARLAEAPPLQDGGPYARCFPHGFTVSFPAPSEQLIRRWGLASAPAPCTRRQRRIAHIITMPGISELALAACVDDLLDEQRRTR